MKDARQKLVSPSKVSPGGKEKSGGMKLAPPSTSRGTRVLIANRKTCMRAYKNFKTYLDVNCTEERIRIVLKAFRHATRRLKLVKVRYSE